jgi:2-phosphoglycerate kinase
MAKRLIKDIKCYHANVFLSSNSSIQKVYDGYTVSPVIVAGGLQGVFIRSKISGVGTIFELLVHVLPGPNKQRPPKKLAFELN